MPTKIEWCTETWNPIVGCTPVSAGCANCYAARMAKRQIAMGNKNYAGTVDEHGRWTGKVNLVPDALEKPLHWRKPRTVFVNSMSDLFHADVPFEFIDKVFAVMALSPQHTFQVLTKRPERMEEYFSKPTRAGFDAPLRSTQWCIWITCYHFPEPHYSPWSWNADSTKIVGPWPLPNVHLGVSVENQETANERIPWLLKTAAAMRWVSLEPMLGPVDLYSAGMKIGGKLTTKGRRMIDGVVVGGESGPGARPLDPDWVRSVRDQCRDAGVAFFFKQMIVGGKKVSMPMLDGRTWDELPGDTKGF